jgi:hypothetical protein
MEGSEDSRRRQFVAPLNVDDCLSVMGLCYAGCDWCAVMVFGIDVDDCSAVIGVWFGRCCLIGLYGALLLRLVIA